MGPRHAFLDKYYLWSLGLFILALLSKPMAVSLPAVLLIVDWYPMNRIGSLKTSRAVFYEKLPFILLSLASAIVTIFAQHAGGSLSSIEAIPLGTRLLVAGRSLIAYLLKIIYPHDLVPFYPYPDIREVSLSHVEYFALILILIGVTAACMLMMKKQKLWLSAWSYYLITLAPVIGIMQVGGQSMADRYLYLPSLGPFLVVGILAAWFYARVRKAAKWFTVVKVISIAMACMVIIFMSYLTVRQIGIWKNSFIILNSILEKEPGKDPRVYFHRGRAYEKIDKFDNAIEDYNRAIALDPFYYQAYFMRGMVFEKTGRFNDAIEDYSRVIAINPSYYEVYNNRGMLYKKLGQNEKAIEDLIKAIASNPSFDENTYFNLGYAYAEAGLYDKAILTFDQVITVDPTYTDAYANRAIVYAVIGQRERALDDFNKAIELKPGEAVNYFNRGNFYMTTGRKELAIADFQKACSLGDQISCRALH
jgi:Tfp pilus assembly protein PilF